MLEHIYEYIQKKSDYLQRCKKKKLSTDLRKHHVIVK